MQFIKQSVTDSGLNRREGSAKKANPFNSIRIPSGKEGAMRQVVLLILIVVGIVIIAGLIIFKRNPEKLDQPVKTMHITPATQANLATKINPAAVSASTNNIIKPTVVTPVNALTTLVQAINISGDKQSTRLSIFLNKTARFSILRDGNQNTLSLFLDDTQMAEPLLPLNTKNTLINAVTVNNVGTQLKVSMTVQPGIQIAQLRLDDQSATPQLILDLGGVNQDTTVTAVDTSTIEANSLNNNILEKADLKANADSSTGGSMEKILVPLSAQERAEQGYQTALNYLQANQIDKAEMTLRNLLKQTPDYAIARQALVTLLLQQNNLQEAQQVLQDGIALQPGYPIFTQLSAQVLLKQGKTYAALKKMQTVKPVLIEYPEYYAFAAALYQRTGHFREAATIYSKLVSLNTNNSVWWIGLGVALESMNKRNLALEAYQTAIANNNLSYDLQNYANTRIGALGG